MHTDGKQVKLGEVYSDDWIVDSAIKLAVVVHSETFRQIKNFKFVARVWKFNPALFWSNFGAQIKHSYIWNTAKRCGEGVSVHSRQTVMFEVYNYTCHEVMIFEVCSSRIFYFFFFCYIQDIILLFTLWLSLGFDSQWWSMLIVSLLLLLVVTWMHIITTGLTLQPQIVTFVQFLTPSLFF